MAKIELSGLDDYMAKLQKLGQDGPKICRAAVFEGADEVADAIRAKIEEMPTTKDKAAIIAWKQETPISTITEDQKRGLLKGLYLKKMREEGGFIYTQIGFSGYNTTKTQKYPNGQPNALIARSVESGSSARPKKPFVRPTVNAVKATAVARMQGKLIEMIDNIMN